MNSQVAINTIELVAKYFDLDDDLDIKLVVTPKCEEGNAYVVPICPGEYEIEINPVFLDERTTREVVQLVAHEMVHIKQFEREELDNNIFKGEFHDPDDYWFSPWEIEARGYEEAFWHLYQEGKCIQRKK